MSTPLKKVSIFCGKLEGHVGFLLLLLCFNPIIVCGNTVFSVSFPFFKQPAAFACEVFNVGYVVYIKIDAPASFGRLLT